MSSSTIETTIRAGERTLQKLAAKQERLLADRGSLIEEYSGERTRELDSRGLDNPEELGGLLGRLDASAPIAGRRELSKAKAVLDQALEGGSLEEAREVVERLEVESVRGWADRTERELLLDELVERTGVRVKEGTKEMQADGRLTASVEIPKHGTVPVSISGSRSSGDPESTALWRTVESDIVGDGTQTGACEAQREAVDEVAEKSAGQMSVVDAAEAEEPAPKPHHVSREAR